MGLFDSNMFRTKKITTETVTPEIEQFKRKLYEMEQQKQQITIEIGKLYVAKNELTDVVGTEFEPLLQQLAQIAKESTVLNKKILAAQGLRKCEKCENILSLDSAFCNKCGEKLSPLFEAEDLSENMCSKCGATLSAGAAFCTFCGTKAQE